MAITLTSRKRVMSVYQWHKLRFLCIKYEVHTNFFVCFLYLGIYRGGSRIWSKGGTASEAKSCWHSAVMWAMQAICFRALQACGILMLKYAFSHIVKTHFLSFLTSTSTLKNLQFILVEKWHAEWSQAGKFLNLNCEK